MRAVTPVLPNSQFVEVVYAANQPEYTPLPVVRTEKMLVSRWRLTVEERLAIAKGADLFLVQMHFGDALQPICPIVGDAETVVSMLVEGS